MDDAFIVLASVEEVKLFNNQQLFNHRKTHTICLCSQLLFYSKCTGFTICFTFSNISVLKEFESAVDCSS